jgi:hypothetical protein
MSLSAQTVTWARQQLPDLVHSFPCRLFPLAGRVRQPHRMHMAAAAMGGFTVQTLVLRRLSWAR